VVNQPLVEVETAKAAVELPSPYAGRVVARHADEGAVLPLIRLLNDDSKEIRDKVQVTLERMTGETLNLSGSSDPTDGRQFRRRSDGPRMDEAAARIADVSRVKEWWIRKKHEVATEPDAPEPEAVADIAAETFATEPTPNTETQAPEAAEALDAEEVAPPGDQDEQDSSVEVGKKRMRRR
jgi:pyruvate/2-oxoglutarate dehydrogenase complex dihydrolipoamide acyltransferase (E2) component